MEEGGREAAQHCPRQSESQLMGALVCKPLYKINKNLWNRHIIESRTLVNDVGTCAVRTMHVVTPACTMQWFNIWQGRALKDGK